MNKDIVLKKSVDFTCSHCHCTSKITEIRVADVGVTGRSDYGKNEYMKYAGRQDPECLLQAMQAKKTIDANDYDYWIACPICSNRGAKFKMGEEYSKNWNDYKEPLA